MYYNVVVKDGLDFYESNCLTFHFGDNFQEALDFAEKILKISDFNIEFLQFEENEGKE